MKSYYYLQLLKGLDICVKYIAEKQGGEDWVQVSSEEATNVEKLYKHTRQIY